MDQSASLDLGLNKVLLAPPGWSILGRTGSSVGEHAFVYWRTVNTGRHDPAWHAWQLENLRRSLAMLRPEQVAGLSREQAIELIEELQQVQSRLDRLRSALRH